MTEHAHIKLKDGRDLEFPLYPDWREESEWREISERETVIRIARVWFKGVEDCQFEDDDIIDVRIAR